MDEGRPARRRAYHCPWENESEGRLQHYAYRNSPPGWCCRALPHQPRPPSGRFSIRAPRNDAEPPRRTPVLPTALLRRDLPIVVCPPRGTGAGNMLNCLATTIPLPPVAIGLQVGRGPSPGAVAIAQARRWLTGVGCPLLGWDPGSIRAAQASSDGADQITTTIWLVLVPERRDRPGGSGIRRLGLSTSRRWPQVRRRPRCRRDDGPDERRRMVVSCRVLEAVEDGVVWDFAEGRRDVTAAQPVQRGAMLSASRRHSSRPLAS
jgi:hypothetical protein